VKFGCQILIYYIILTSNLEVKAVARNLGLKYKYINKVQLWNSKDNFLKVEFLNKPALKPKSKKKKGEKVKSNKLDPKD
jgi:hypothetical protein